MLRPSRLAREALTAIHTIGPDVSSDAREALSLAQGTGRTAHSDPHVGHWVGRPFNIGSPNADPRAWRWVRDMTSGA